MTASLTMVTIINFTYIRINPAQIVKLTKTV